MLYRLLPLGKAWEQGMLALPKVIATDYLKLASEYQLKALLIILACDGQADSKHISKVLGCTENDAVDFLEFWLEEGILSCDGEARVSLVTQKSESSEPTKKARKSRKPLLKLKRKSRLLFLRRSDRAFPHILKARLYQCAVTVRS